MFDWLKFFPLAWRDNNKPDEIRGPYFSKPRKKKWFIGDCALFFDAPRSNPIFGFSGRDRKLRTLSPGTANILKSEWDEVYMSTPNSPPAEWILSLFCQKTWYFTGPWFTGEKARLTMGGILYTADQKHSFFGKNLFHPRVFESAIANYLDKVYGYEKSGSGRKAQNRGPLNWHLIPISSTIPAVVCDIHIIGNSCKENPMLLRHVFIPVSPQQFIRIIFDFGGVAIYRDEVRSKPLFALCDSIINSFRLEVGPQTQAEWDKVKADCPDMRITDSMDEFPWPLKKYKPEKKNKERDITFQQRTLP